MNLLRVFFISMCFILPSHLSRAGQAPLPEEVSYHQYINQVLAYYPSLKKEHANIEKTIAQKALVASSRLPHLWLSAKFDYGNDPVYVFGALLRQNRFTSDDFALDRLNKPSSYSDNSAGVQGQWLLFDFSQTASRVKSVGLLDESARFQWELTHMEAILAASEVYSRLAVTEQLLIVIREAARAAQEDISVAQSLNRKGMVLGADFYTARISQSQLEQLNNEITAQKAALSMAFNVLRGADPSLPVEVSLDFKRPLKLQGTVEDWMAKTAGGRLDIKALNKILQAQGIQQKIEKKSFLPKVVAYGDADEHTHSFAGEGRGSYMVGLKAQMDIFDPGYGPRIKMAKEEFNRLSAQVQELKDQAAKDTAETFYRLKALETNSVLASRIYNDSRQSVRLMQPLYKEGRSGIYQMVNARSGLVEAYQRWLTTQAARRQSLLTLEFYAGVLNEKEAEVVYGQ